MEQIQLTALRDFAIRHHPRAQKVSLNLPKDQYQLTLYGIAILTHANAPAIEQAAAHLLRTVMSLSIDWGIEGTLSSSERQAEEHDAAQAADTLCKLTATTIPWLSTALVTFTSTPNATPVTAVSTPERPLLQPGPTQTTAYAARYLGVTEQCMRSWASKDSGPIKPVKMGVRNGWPTAELERLGVEGWKSRRQKQAG